jgi:tetratricopeptide (TPR) repeat protein
MPWMSRAAEEAAATACRLQPWSAQAHFLRVRTALDQRDFAAAWQAADRVRQLQPNAALGFHARGLIQLKQQQWAEAAEEYEHALVLAPNDPTLLTNYGLAQLNLGHETTAIDYFTRAGQANPHSDLYRRNTVVAARRHLAGGSRFSIQSLRGVVLLVAALTTFGVFGKWVGLAVVAGAVVFVVVMLVFQRVRKSSLPSAARIALEVSDRERHERYGLSLTRKQWRAVSIGIALACLAGAGAAALASFHTGSTPSTPTGADICKDLKGSFDPQDRVTFEQVCPTETTAVSGR